MIQYSQNMEDDPNLKSDMSPEDILKLPTFRRSISPEVPEEIGHAYDACILFNPNERFDWRNSSICSSMMRNWPILMTPDVITLLRTNSEPPANWVWKIIFIYFPTCPLHLRPSHLSLHCRAGCRYTDTNPANCWGSHP